MLTITKHFIISKYINSGVVILKLILNTQAISDYWGESDVTTAY